LLIYPIKSFFRDDLLLLVYSMEDFLKKAKMSIKSFFRNDLLLLVYSMEDFLKKARMSIKSFFRNDLLLLVYSIEDFQKKASISIRTFVKEKDFIRLILLIFLVFYLTGPRFFSAEMKSKALPDFPVEAENGVGGGINPEKLVQDLDLELAGIPEPEEYSLPHMLTFSSYTLIKGDMIGSIAAGAGLNEDTLISVNDIKNTRLLQIGRVIRIPNQDGIFYTVKTGDTLESIAEMYKTTVSRLNTVNELFSDTIAPNITLFIPGAKLDWVNRQEINGDLFFWPCGGFITSSYGYRENPFDGARQFHSGLDIGAPMGAPVRAAMAGRVSQTGSNDLLGNHVVISHHSGYRTLYAHMSIVRVKAGAYVGTGERIGDVGMSGLATGPHLHFTVYKNGVTVNPLALMR
jgi:murein DD-endopeptidase MepM/ murein hydrolase activator NlpD